MRYRVVMLIPLMALLPAMAAEPEPLAGDHALRADHAAVLEERWGSASGSASAQRVSLGRAELVLLSHTAAHARPVLVLPSRVRADPLEGIADYVYSPAIGAVSHETAALVWYGTRPRGVPRRPLDTEGSSLGDAVVFRDRGDGEVQVLEWPGVGLLVGYSAINWLGLQLLGTDGEPRWPDGKLLREGHGRSPLRMVHTRGDAVVVFHQPALGSAGHYVALRYTSAGDEVWATPADLGEAAVTMAGVSEPIRVDVMGDGTVRMVLWSGVAGDAIWRVVERTVLLRPDGAVDVEGAGRQVAPRR